MPLFTDQIGHTLQINHLPTRIVSLVPSQTELLWYLGLETEVIAITKFCVHPHEWYRNKTRIGGTKNLHLDTIHSLQPDLILANKEENVKNDIELLSKDFPVWTSDVNTFQEALAMISAVSEITGRKQEGEMLIEGINKNFRELNQTGMDAIPAIYLIWKDPYMAAGGNCFIDDMLQWAGFENIMSRQSRYPETDLKEYAGIKDLVVLLSSEPYPFQSKHVQEIREVLPLARIVLADGEMFSWYGSRMLKAPAYFMELRKEVLSLTDAAGTR